MNQVFLFVWRERTVDTDNGSGLNQVGAHDEVKSLSTRMLIYIYILDHRRSVFEPLLAILRTSWWVMRFVSFNTGVEPVADLGHVRLICMGFGILPDTKTLTGVYIYLAYMGTNLWNQLQVSVLCGR